MPDWAWWWVAIPAIVISVVTVYAALNHYLLNNYWDVMVPLLGRRVADLVYDVLIIPWLGYEFVRRRLPRGWWNKK